MLICFGVFEMWSRPRMTCVMPSSQSSTRRGEVVGRAAVAADDDEVVERLVRRLDVAEDQVVVCRRALVGHAEADRPLVLVRVAGFDEAPRLLLAAVHALELEAERLPVEAEPGQGALDLLGGALDLAVHVRVLDAQQAVPALLAREEPVEEERARGADVEEPRRRRRHTNSHGETLFPPCAPFSVLMVDS